MKILNILINEYNTLDELIDAFKNMPSEMKENGAQLMSSKEKAEKNLKYQFKLFNIKGARVFWWSKESYNGVETYVMHESIFD